MKVFDIHCALSPTNVHRMRPVDGQYLQCLDCDSNITVLENAFIMAALKGTAPLDKQP